MAQPTTEHGWEQSARAAQLHGTEASAPPAPETLADCLRHLARAAASFERWRRLSPTDRAAGLLSLANRLEENEEALRLLMAEELGTPASWARFNVDFAARTLRETADLAPLLTEDEVVRADPGRHGLARRMPCGVSLGIAPWNAPLILGVRAIAAPLLCGNTVLLKGSEFAPRTFRMLGALMEDAGLAPDIARVFVTRAEDSEEIVSQLIAAPVVRRVNFTGSTRVGRRIAELCAQHLKRPLLELGGQATAIVLPGADIAQAARAIAQGAWTNQGQICMSTERVIAVGDVADALAAELSHLRNALRFGDPFDETTEVGPVVSDSAATRIATLIAEAGQEGAQILGGGTRQGRMIEPTLIDHVSGEMRLAREEAFGPVLSILRVRSQLEALTLANDSDYALAMAVFDRDSARAERFAEDLDCGICHINAPTLGDHPAAPFGGTKMSGFGRFGGRWALDEFTETRWLTRPDEDA